MERSFVHILERRKTEQYAARSNSLLASMVTFTAIDLDDILDAERVLMDGHVILGFTRNGQHLISYQCHIDAAHVYSLHWWRFDLRSPLHHVHSEELFRGEKIEHDLHLIIGQTPDDGFVVVFGSALDRLNEDCRPCYVTVLPSCNVEATTFEKQCTFHFKFELLQPYPPFSPSLSLSLTGCVVLNTGDSLVVLCYAADACQRVPQSAPSSSSTHTHQLFIEPSEGGSISPGYSVSPSQLLLPLEGCTEVCQSTLDIEHWLSNLLHSELTKRGVLFNSVNDYDMQLIEVTSDGHVVFAVTVVLEACKSSSCIADSLTTLIVAVWNTHTGLAECIEFEELKQVCPPHRIRSSTTSLTLELRKMWHTPMSMWSSVRAFSNHTVFTGKSLHSISHPLLPLAVVFRAHQT
ncbi:hypothetical protein EMCRGX_G018876 [Ephydatia muelleri]